MLAILPIENAEPNRQPRRKHLLQQQHARQLLAR